MQLLLLMSFENILVVVQYNITNWLDLPSLARLGQCSRKVNTLCSAEIIWAEQLDMMQGRHSDYQAIGNNVIEKCRNIYGMIIQYQYITRYQKIKSLSELYQLRMLDIAINVLVNLPTLYLPNLHSLFIYDCGLTTVPNFSLPNLQTLFLQYNHLKSIPNFVLPKIQTLRLNNNQLSELPYIDMPDLEFLDLGDNHFTRLPAYLGQLNIRKLILGSNPIIEWPITFRNIHQYIQH